MTLADGTEPGDEDRGIPVHILESLLCGGIRG
jgi:hypothetical protein